VNEFSVVAPGIAIVPLTVRDPVLRVTILSLLALVVLAKVKLAQLTIPVPIAMVWFRVSTVGSEKTMSPVTLKVKAPEIFRKLLSAFVAKLIELHSAPVAFIVTVMFELIVTDSAEVGTAEPPQVAVSCQFPLTLATLWANKSVTVLRNKNTSSINFKFAPVFLQDSNGFSRIEIFLRVWCKQL